MKLADPSLDKAHNQEGNIPSDEVLESMAKTLYYGNDRTLTPLAYRQVYTQWWRTSPPFNVSAAPLYKRRTHVHGSVYEEAFYKRTNIPFNKPGYRLDKDGRILDGFVYLTHDGLAVADNKELKASEIEDFLEQQHAIIRQQLEENMHMLVGGLRLISPELADTAIRIRTYSDHAQLGWQSHFDVFSGHFASTPRLMETEGLQIGLHANHINLQKLEELANSGFTTRERDRFSRFALIDGITLLKARYSEHTKEKKETHLCDHVTYMADITLPGQIYANISFTGEAAAEEFIKEANTIYRELRATHLASNIVTPDELIRMRSLGKEMTLQQKWLTHGRRELLTEPGLLLQNAASPFCINGNSIIYNIADSRVELILDAMLVRQVTQSALEKLPDNYLNSVDLARAVLPDNLKQHLRSHSTGMRRR